MRYFINIRVVYAASKGEAFKKVEENIFVEDNDLQDKVLTAHEAIGSIADWIASRDVDKYVVTWAEKAFSPSGVVYVNKFQVFVDQTSTKNASSAFERYNELLDSRLVYTANISKILESTDY